MIDQILAMLGPRFDEEQLRGGARKAAEASYMAQNPRLGGSESPLHMLAPLLQGEGGMREAAGTYEDANRKAAEAEYIANNSPQNSGGGGILSMLRKRGPGIMGALRMGIDAAATPNTTGSLGANVMGGLSNAMNMRDQRTQQGYENTYKQVVAKQAQEKLRQEWQKHLDDLEQKGADRQQRADQFEVTSGQNNRKIDIDQAGLTLDQAEAYDRYAANARENGFKPDDRPTWFEKVTKGGGTIYGNQVTENEMTPAERAALAESTARARSTEAGAVKSELEGKITEKELANWEKTYGLDTQYKQSQIDRNRASAKESRANAAFLGSPVQGGLTKEQAAEAAKLRNEVQGLPVYKEYNEIKAGFGSVIDGLRESMRDGGSQGFGDVTAINGFQRLIDPGATVREGDIALIEQAKGLFQKWGAWDYVNDRIMKGAKLTPDLRQSMARIAKQLYDGRVSNFNDMVSVHRNAAEARGIDFDRYIVAPMADVDNSITPKGPPMGSGNKWGLSDEELEIAKDRAAKSQMPLDRYMELRERKRNGR